LTTGPDETAGINGALTQRRGEIDGQAVIAFVNTIQVEDMGETQRRVEAAGGTQVVKPDTIPGIGTVAYFKDTEGNILGALEPAGPGAG
jgi:predicted enzyme related to lactoylglutathione lyase